MTAFKYITYTCTNNLYNNMASEKVFISREVNNFYFTMIRLLLFTFYDYHSEKCLNPSMLLAIVNRSPMTWELFV